MFLPNEIWREIVKYTIRKGKLWVVYVTVMEKATATTEFVGIFENKDHARTALLEFLIDDAYLFYAITGELYRDVEPDDWEEYDWSEHDWSKYDWDASELDDITQTFVMAKTAIKQKSASKELLDKCVEKYSYRATSIWTHTIKSVTVNRD